MPRGFEMLRVWAVAGLPPYDNKPVQSHVFPVVIEGDRFENGIPAYHAFCPALKGCHTWGHSPEEALANIREAAKLYVEDLIGTGDPIPR